MAYYIDLSKITLNQFKESLITSDLIPSRRPLLNNIDYQFSLLTNAGIQSIKELLIKCKNKQATFNYSEETQVDIDYLTLLLREIKSYQKTPPKLKDFSCLSQTSIQKLEQQGIKTAVQLYDKVLTPQDRFTLSESVQVNEDELRLITQLCDLTRIKWVNSTFAFVLYTCGYKTTEAVAKADYTKLYEDILSQNKEKQLYKGNIGLNDVKLCVEEAKKLTIDITYSSK